MNCSAPRPTYSAFLAKGDHQCSSWDLACLLVVAACDTVLPKEGPDLPGLTCVHLSGPSAASCPPTNFQCRSDGRCVPLTWRCDVDKDCLDGSDEEECSEWPCPGGGACKGWGHREEVLVEGMWLSDRALWGGRGLKGRRSGERWVCSGAELVGSGGRACREASPWKVELTEAGGGAFGMGETYRVDCSRKAGLVGGWAVGSTWALLAGCLRPDSPCTPGTEPCAQDGQCKPPTGSPCSCDSIDDCPDGINKNVLNCRHQPCPEGELRCPLGGSCIPRTWLCDGHPDCSDSSDELGCGVCLWGRGGWVGRQGRLTPSSV